MLQLLHHARPRARERAWELVGFGIAGAQRVDCEFCGHKNLVNLYFVREPVTKKEYIVGSECGPNLTGAAASAVETMHVHYGLPEKWRDGRSDVPLFLKTKDFTDYDAARALERLKREMTLLKRAAALGSTKAHDAVTELLDGPTPERMVWDSADVLDWIGRDRPSSKMAIAVRGTRSSTAECGRGSQTASGGGCASGRCAATRRRKLRRPPSANVQTSSDVTLSLCRKSKHAASTTKSPNASMSIRMSRLRSEGPRLLAGCNVASRNESARARERERERERT